MEKQKIVIGVLAVLAVVVVVVFFFLIRSGTFSGENWGMKPEQAVSPWEPLDVVMDFYNPWLEARQSTTTNPYALGLASNPILSPLLRDRLIASEHRAEGDIDPVLCQTTVPEKVNARIVSEQEDLIRILVLSRDKTLTAQSTFELKPLNDGWYIDDIVCAAGEFAPDREFTFDQEGYLLKSVPPPLDPQYWHVVFELDGVPGHTAPLFFDGESTCVSPDGVGSACDTNTFSEPTRARVFGQMTELGVEVDRIEFKE